MTRAVCLRALTFLLLPVILLTACTTTPETKPASPTGATDYSMATSVARIDALQVATPVSGEAARTLGALERVIDDCADFSDARREQILQHIAWLRAPDSIPSDVAMALGMRGNIGAALLHGMAIYTSTEWRLLERQPTSCLVPIGRALDILLRDVGAAPVGIYDE